MGHKPTLAIAQNAPKALGDLAARLFRHQERALFLAFDIVL